MKLYRFIFPFLLLVGASVVSCSKEKPNEYNLIPLPQEMTPKEGKFTITSSTVVLVPEGIPEIKSVAENFVAHMERVSGLKLAIVEGGDCQNNSICFGLLKNINGEHSYEAYKLNVTTSKVEILAYGDAGAFYAVQTIYQLLPPQVYGDKAQSVKWTIPCVEINDYPSFVYRGLHLDVARHFSSVDYIKRYIDMIAYHKQNVFHWHLTDDQGWRIEIKSHPKLTEIGSKRKETLVGSYYDEYPQVFDGKEHSGYYTQEEVKEVIEYARQRFVTVVPEIEMPGHAVAALAAYPELACTSGPFEVEKKWGIFKDVFCPKEETFKFLEEVLTEVIDLFPSQYIHVGGDECPKDRWKECAHCQALMKKEKLKDENELQSYFIKRIEKFVASKGRKLVGWDEIIDGGLPQDATVMSWRGVKGGITAASQGHDVIMTPTTFCYIDYYDYDPYFEPVQIFGYLTVQTVYSYNPIPEDLDKDKHHHILGVQGNLWVEYSPDAAGNDYRAFPRAFALAETGWTSKERKDYYDFARRLKGHMEHLDVYGLGYSKNLFSVVATPKHDTVSNKLTVTLDGQYDPKLVHYTTDGSQPTANSPLYTDPIEIAGRVVIKAATFEDGKLLGRIFEREYVAHKALGVSSKIGEEATVKLTDGLRANIYENPGWRKKPVDMVRGIEGEDMVIEMDLGSVQPISKVTACMLNQPLYMVVAAKELKLAYSEDGKTYTEVPAVAVDNKEPKNRRHVEAPIQLDGVNARYLKVTLVNAGSVFPKGSTNEGKPSLIMADEIMVE